LRKHFSGLRIIGLWDSNTGPNNIPVIFLKLAADFLAGPLTAIINNCIDSLKYPTLWKLIQNSIRY
jgi:hypothetical protein